MKKIVKYLGVILVALSALALLITAVAVFKSPITNFFGNAIAKEISIGNDVLSGIENVDLSIGAGS